MLVKKESQIQVGPEEPKEVKGLDDTEELKESEKQAQEEKKNLLSIIKHDYMVDGVKNRALVTINDCDVLHAAIVSYLAALELDMSKFTPTIFEQFNSKAYCRAKAEKLCEKLIASS